MPLEVLVTVPVDQVVLTLETVPTAMQEDQEVQVGLVW